MKTIEEAAKERAGLKKNQRIDDEEKYYNGHLCEKYFCFKSGVEFAQRWISIEEELPETNEFCESKKCIVKNATYNCVDIARYYSNTNTWYFDSTDFIVTHWRPIDIT